MVVTTSKMLLNNFLWISLYSKIQDVFVIDFKNRKNEVLHDPVLFSTTYHLSSVYLSVCVYHMCMSMKHYLFLIGIKFT